MTDLIRYLIEIFVLMFGIWAYCMFMIWWVSRGAHDPLNEERRFK